MSTSVDVYALPRLPSTNTRGPTRVCTCILLLLLVVAIVALAPSLMVSIGGDSITVTLPTTATGEAPLPLMAQRGLSPAQVPEAAQRFSIAHAQWQAAAVAGAERNDPEVLSGLNEGWRDALESADHAQARFIADVAHTLGWLVEQARAPR